MSEHTIDSSSEELTHEEREFESILRPKDFKDFTGQDKIVENNDYQDYTAQQAVWVMTDDQPLKYISNGADKVVYELRSYIAIIKDIPMDYSGLGAGYVEDTYTISGTIKFDLSKPSKVTLLIVDGDGNTIKTIMHENAFNQGNHRLAYSIEGILDPTEMFAIELFIDDAYIRRYYTSH